jgi:hypothetical protein
MRLRLAMPWQHQSAAPKGSPQLEQNRACAAGLYPQAEQKVPRAAELLFVAVEGSGVACADAANAA